MLSSGIDMAVFDAVICWRVALVWWRTLCFGQHAFLGRGDKAEWPWEVREFAPEGRGVWAKAVLFCCEREVDMFVLVIWRRIQSWSKGRYSMLFEQLVSNVGG